VSQFSLMTHSVEETRLLGEKLGEVVGPGTLILLSGDLGAGKTSFTQGLGVGLETSEDEPVVSPSYTLMNHYRGRLDLYHFDLYRLHGSEDLDDLDFTDYVEGVGITVVEWCDRVPELSRSGLLIRIEHAGEDCRRFFFQAENTAELKMLEAFRAKLDADPAG